MFGKKKKKKIEEVNASSMADIAFLLLVFFLIASSINKDTGLTILLPPKRDPKDNTIVDINERNLFTVLVNSQNQLLVEGKLLELKYLKDEVKEFLTNNGKDPKSSDSPKKAVVSLKTDMGTDYKTYISVLDQIKSAYHELRARKLGITIQEYLKYNEADEVGNECLQRKVRMFRKSTAKADDDNSFSDWITAYLKYDINKADDNKTRKAAYQQARAICPDTYAERFNDAKKAFPLQISEAEPSKTE